MKLRNPLGIRVVSLLASWILRGWLGTLTYRMVWDDPAAMPEHMPRRAVYLFWHEMMLYPAYTHARRRIAVLVSQHADGELITQVVRMLGGRAVRGSTNKRGLSALRGLMRTGKVSHLAITPDGPRGPRRVIQPGAIFLASRTGMPLVPIGLAYRRCWRHRSWDRMAFPYPGEVAQAVIGVPLDVPPELDRDGLERYRLRAQAAMDGVQRRAEELVHVARVRMNSRLREAAA
jgi:lysophospholipid acyltransferase (LPLAT)-like uncharacterized protein